jgi:hypothetical protein
MQLSKEELKENTATVNDGLKSRVGLQGDSGAYKKEVKKS